MQLIEWLKGNKSYILTVILTVMGALVQTGVIPADNKWVQVIMILTGGGLGLAFRAGMNNAAKKAIADSENDIVFGRARP